MRDLSIIVENLVKVYRLYADPVDRLKESMHPLRKKYHQDFYALRNVNFEIKKGETVGIIGRNGCGKSTLLQIIAGILTPTAGNVFANGKIAALLELGTGFNPEFSGLENIYFGGALMGFSQEEMDRKIDQILSFADIGDFVKQPVKTYSSGMMVRLAFALSINIDPEILIVDEALSVGDELFQRKCFSRIEAIKNSGTTILFVSHSAGTIIELCDQAILLDSGEKLAMDTPKSIVGKYQKLIYAPQEKQAIIRREIILSNENQKCNLLYKPLSSTDQKDQKSLIRSQNVQEIQEEYFEQGLNPQSTIEYESHGAYISSPKILTQTGKKVNCLLRGKKYLYTYNVRFDQDATNVRFGMMIKTTSGLELGGAVSAPTSGQGIPYLTAGSIVAVEFQFICNLNPGAYFLNAGITGTKNAAETFLHRVLDICMFKVIPIVKNSATGICFFNCSVKAQFENVSLSETMSG